MMIQQLPCNKLILKYKFRDKSENNFTDPFWILCIPDKLFNPFQISGLIPT